MNFLDQPNDFMILSNDLHEIRILDRAIRFASADIICLVQDDDTIPNEPDWAYNALAQFRKHPKLAIVGGFMGFHGFHPKSENVKQIWREAPFQFVEHVNIGPFFIRKKHYETIGGWDYSFSKVGEPAICFDNELCLRAWTKGYQVGYKFVPFKGPEKQYFLNGGTMLFSHEIRRNNQLRNEKRIYNEYKKFAKKIANSVRKANLSIGHEID